MKNELLSLEHGKELTGMIFECSYLQGFDFDRDEAEITLDNPKNCNSEMLAILKFAGYDKGHGTDVSVTAVFSACDELVPMCDREQYGRYNVAAELVSIKIEKRGSCHGK